ncbi:MAG: N-acyl homoserine lactonase family protein [Proteobacteria bacterium]|nr:N-acyl homoserine lactonase family protein [Pseudomonadota bacterium]
MFLYLTDIGVELEIAYRLWVILGGPEPVVVDTGPPLDEAHRRGITDVRDIDSGLLQLGIRATDVRTVVLTHLHWDHAANASRFPNATFLAQRLEIDFFADHLREHPSMNRFFSHQAMLAELIATGRVRAVHGDQQLFAGVRTIKVGGHTPGSQMLVVDGSEGTLVITGDAIPLHRNYTDSIPSGIVVNTLEAIAALHRVRTLDAARLFTGHDLEPSLALARATHEQPPQAGGDHVEPH